MPSDLRVCCKYQLFSRGRRQLTSSGEKQLEADVAVAALGTFVSLSQANNVGEGICAVFVFTSSSPTVLPHRVTQSGALWLCLHQLGSWDSTLSCSDTAADFPSECRHRGSVLGAEACSQHCGLSVSVSLFCLREGLTM